jgi:hypothetical protein
MKLIPLIFLVAATLAAPNVTAQDLSQGRWVDLTHPFNVSGELRN